MALTLDTTLLGFYICGGDDNANIKIIQSKAMPNPTTGGGFKLTQ